MSCEGEKLGMSCFQGSAKAVSLIKAVRPTSVNDLDENG